MQQPFTNVMATNLHPETTFTLPDAFFLSAGSFVVYKEAAHSEFLKMNCKHVSNFMANESVETRNSACHVIGGI